MQIGTDNRRLSNHRETWRRRNGRSLQGSTIRGSIETVALEILSPSFADDPIHLAVALRL